MSFSSENRVILVEIEGYFSQQVQKRVKKTVKTKKQNACFSFEKQAPAATKRRVVVGTLFPGYARSSVLILLLQLF